MVARDEALPFGGAHAPTCPHHHRGECLCWRSDPWRNLDLERSDLVRDRGREAVAAAMGYEVPDDRIVEALRAHGGRTIGEVEAELWELEHRLADAGGRGVDLADQVDALRIAAAVMRAELEAAEAVPRVGTLTAGRGTFLVGLDREIRITEGEWPGRKAPTLTVSLDGLAAVLMDEEAIVKPGDVADLMAAICRRAARGAGTDAGLALTEAEAYEADSLGDVDGEDDLDE